MYESFIIELHDQGICIKFLSQSLSHIAYRFLILNVFWFFSNRNHKKGHCTRGCNCENFVAADKLPGTILWLPKYTSALVPPLWKLSFMVLPSLGQSFCDPSFPITSLPNTVSLPVYCQDIKEYNQRTRIITLASYAIQDQFQMCPSSLKSLLLFSPLQRQPLFPSLPHHMHVLLFHIHFHHTLDSSLSQTQPLLSLAKFFSLQLPALVTAFHWTVSLQNQTYELLHLFITSSCSQDAIICEKKFAGNSASVPLSL